MNRSAKFFLCFFHILLFFATTLWAQTPCEDGFAGEYPCNQVDLIAHLSPAELLAEEHNGVWINDLWGWTDPETGKEYALVGMANGTSFVDISNPLNPVVLGILPEHHAAAGGRSGARQAGPLHDGAKSVWRDIKVYQNHAFIVSEDGDHGMQVFDLTQLRNVENPPAEFAETANYQGIGKAHNIVINEETGFAYAVGANSAGKSCNGGGLHMIDIREPSNPQFAGCYDADGYTHDAQCVIYQGPDADYQGQEICFNSNEDAITLVDVSDKNNPVMVSSATYAGVVYAHQGWLTEDHRFFISNDELDERNNGTNTTSYIWDMQDLDNPVLIGTYVSELTSIDHNLYIKDAVAYEANYTTGLRMLSLLNIENALLEEIAYFDTYPNSNSPIFEGAWSNYPFFESGIVIVSDMTHGLFVLRPMVGLVRQEPVDAVACASGEAFFELIPNKPDLSYQWQVNSGEGFTDLEASDIYSNVQTSRLQLTAVPPEFDGYRFRVRISDPETGEEQLSEEAMLSITTTPEAAFEFTEEGRGEIHFTNLSGNATSYRWDFGDGSAIVETQDPVHQFNSQGPFTVILEAISECGSDVFSMEVSPNICGEEELPQAAFEYEEVSRGEIQFTNLSANATSFIWFFGDGSSPVQEEHPLHLYESEGPFSVRLEASNDCGRSVFMLEISPDVCLAQDMPEAAFVYEDIDKGEIHFTNQSVNGTSFRWDFGNGSDPVEEESPVYRYQNEGPFTVSLEVFNECGSDTYLMEIAPDVCMEDDLPIAGFEFSEENGQEVQFTNLSEKAVSFVWDFGDGSAPVEEENPSHRYQSYGPFEVSLTAKNDCGADVYTYTLSSLTGIEDKVLAESLRVYPNPSTGRLYIKWENSASEVVSIAFFNLKGQRLLYKETDPLKENSQQLDLEEFSKGIYFLQLISRRGSVNKKIVLR